MLQSGISIAPAFSVSVNLQDLPVVLVIGAALAALQIFLSRHRARWPGLCLPALWLVWTAAGLLRQAAGLTGMDGGAVLRLVLAALLLENIPNLVFLAIYLVCRLLQKRKLRRQFQKTRIDDL